jgi:hypothetical protein
LLFFRNRRLAFSALDLILLGEFRMIEPKFPLRQFFDFRFGVNAGRFFNLPTLSKRSTICAIRVVRRATIEVSTRTGPARGAA